MHDCERQVCSYEVKEAQCRDERAPRGGQRSTRSNGATLRRVLLLKQRLLHSRKDNATKKIAILRQDDMGNAVNTGGAGGAGRAVLASERPVLLPPIQLRRPKQYSTSPFTSSSSEYEDEDEEGWRTPSPARRTNMDMYSSGSYGGDVNTSSEVDDDMDFYGADSSQPAVMADAVRSFYSPFSQSTCGSLADQRSHSNKHSLRPTQATTCRQHKQ